MIRHAVDQYLAESPDFGPALDKTFGTIPGLRLKGRGEMASVAITELSVPLS